MIFAILDDGTLQVHEGLADVRRRHEAPDIESGAVRLFDVGGRPLTPEFEGPVTERGLFGLRWADPVAPFTLVPAAADVPDLSASLRAVVQMEANAHFSTLDGVRTYLASEARGRG
jgi:hypothetical protein